MVYAGATLFVIIVYIVCLILGIILFFKIWGMTNDVRSILGLLNQPKPQITVKKLILLGKNQDAANIIIEKLVDQLIEMSQSSYSGGKEERRANLTAAIDKAKAKLALIGEEQALPTHLQDVDAFAQYYNSKRQTF